jgi:hypothetical protein
MAAPAAYDPKPEFDYQRQKAAQQVNAQVQQQKDALVRRAAQLGGGVNGAMIKQQQVADQQGGERLDQANDAINTAERAENRRISEKQADQQFASDEAQRGRDFSAGQSDIQRKFLTGERVSGQDFTAGQGELARKFATTERTAGQSFQAGQNDAQRNLQRSIANDDYELKKKAMSAQESQFGQTIDLQRQQFAHEVDVDEFNKTLAQRIQGYNEKPGMLEGLFGNFSTGSLGKADHSMGLPSLGDIF